jgi:hypothetical protein
MGLKQIDDAIIDPIRVRFPHRRLLVEYRSTGRQYRCLILI